MSTPIDRGTGLSPSSLATFLSCRRKYYHSKIAKTRKDADIVDDTEALQVGKAFHKVLEITKHDVEGFKKGDVWEVVKDHGLNHIYHLPLIFSMLKAYKKMHLASGLKVVGCEVIVNTPIFYGIVDVVLTEESGQWWIGDMKTAANYSPNLLPTLPNHPQLNLYAAHYKEVAAALNLDPDKFAGCRYRLSTKSKLVKSKKETEKEYMERLQNVVEAYDFILPLSLMSPQEELYDLKRAKNSLEDAVSNGDTAFFSKNPGSCMNYYRPCEYWSNCHSTHYTETPEIEVITS